MTTKILIKRTTGTGDPSAIDAGELAYKYGNDHLLIGNSGGTAPLVIGGKVFSDKLDHTNGQLNASSAMVTDSDSKIDIIKVKGVTGGSGNVGTISFDNVASTHATTLRGQNVNSNVNIDLPTTSGTLIAHNDSGSITDGMIATGTIANDKLANDSVTVGTTEIDLGTSATTISGVEELTVDNIKLKDNTISTTSGTLIINPNGTSNTVDVANSRITSLGTPTGDADATTKAYVDGRVNGLEIKESVKVATTAAITGVTYSNVNGTLTKNSAGAIGNIDGIALTTNDRILVKNQGGADPNGAHFQNGIYKVTTVGDGSNAFVLTRTNDADAASEITGGSFFFVEQGTVNADNGFVTTHNGTPTLGTTAIAFQQFSGAGQITAGDGIQKSGNEISVDLKANSGLEINGGEIRINLGASTIEGTLAIADGGTGATTASSARDNLGLGTGDSPQFTGIELGHANDTTLTRASAGDINIEGNIIYRAGGTDVPVADGGTGQSSFTANRILIGNGTSALAQVAIGNSGEFLISNGSGSAPSFTDTIDGGQYP